MNPAYTMENFTHYLLIKIKKGGESCIVAVILGVSRDEIVEVFQSVRASFLFDLYPDIKAAYDLVHKLRCIYNHNYTKEVCRSKLALWYNEMENMEQTLKGSYFSTVINIIKIYSDQILNYFNNRSTNDSAGSFNAKIKAYRAGYRDVTDINFFPYTLIKI